MELAAFMSLIGILSVELGIFYPRDFRMQLVWFKSHDDQDVSVVQEHANNVQMVRTVENQLWQGSFHFYALWQP